MIDSGLNFQLAPWRPALEQQFGKQVNGVMTDGASTGALAASAAPDCNVGYIKKRNS
jgi:hypothetical protein